MTRRPFAGQSEPRKRDSPPAQHYGVPSGSSDAMTAGTRPTLRPGGCRTDGALSATRRQARTAPATATRANTATSRIPLTCADMGPSVGRPARPPPTTRRAAGFRRVRVAHALSRPGRQDHLGHRGSRALQPGVHRGRRRRGQRSRGVAVAHRRGRVAVAAGPGRARSPCRTRRRWRTCWTGSWPRDGSRCAPSARPGARSPSRTSSAGSGSPGRPRSWPRSPRTARRRWCTNAAGRAGQRAHGRGAVCATSDAVALAWRGGSASSASIVQRFAPTRKRGGAVRGRPGAASRCSRLPRTGARCGAGGPIPRFRRAAAAAGRPPR